MKLPSKCVGVGWSYNLQDIGPAGTGLDTPVLGLKAHSGLRSDMLIDAKKKMVPDKPVFL